MDLTRKQNQYLKGLAHKLAPAVQTGKAGLTPAIVKEVARNLADHELIKVRINCDERAEFLALTEQLVTGTGAILVQTIGRIAVLYREAAEPVIKFPGKNADIIERAYGKTSPSGKSAGSKSQARKSPARKGPPKKSPFGRPSTGKPYGKKSAPPQGRSGSPLRNKQKKTVRS